MRIRLFGLGGQWVRVTNQGAAAIVVRGYRGEPFLQLSGTQVQVNELSATAAETVQTRRAVAADPTAAPRWAQLPDGDSATWTDARITAPSGSGLASMSWTLPLVVDGQQVTVAGTTARIVPPSPLPWLAALALIGIAVGAIGWTQHWRRPMATAAAAGIMAFVAHVLVPGLRRSKTGRSSVGSVSGWWPGSAC
ncbi:MAG: hypothetical protein LC644_07325 [Pseudonocardia sp.]|nr:hypothetical protein [Pseudonocardia sp.]